MTSTIGKATLSIGTLALVVGLGTTLLAFRGQAGDKPGSGPKPPESPAKSSELPHDLLALMQAADRVWVVDEPTDAKPIPEPAEVIKGMSPPEKAYSFAFKAEALKQLPRNGNRWIVFLKSIDEVDHIPKIEPIAGERWYLPADENTIAALRAYVPPCEWGDELNGLRLGLYCRATADEPTVEVVLQNVGKRDLRIPQFRGNYFDDWPHLRFSVGAPDRKSYALDRVGGPHKDSDAPNQRLLKPGERYIHVVRLDRWLSIPDNGRGTTGNAPAGLFAMGGDFKVRAKYANIDRDTQIGWEGEIASDSILIPVPKLGLFGDAAGKFRLRLRQPGGPFRVGDLPNLACDLKYTGKTMCGVYNLPERAEVELDGNWYSLHRQGAIEGDTHVIAPETEYDSWLRLKPDSQWIQLRDKPDADDPAIKEAIPFRLTAGKHTIRIAYTFSKTERAISNAVTLDVASDGWGEPSGGVKARLRLAKTRFAPGDPLVFELDLRNLTNNNRSIVPIPFNCSIEMDGRWYIFHGEIDYKAAAKELKPNGELSPFVKVMADDRWKTNRWDGERGNLRESDPNFNFLPLRLTPGKHAIRVSCVVDAGKSGPTSNAVEIEVESIDPAVKALALSADRIWVVNAPTRAKPVPVSNEVLKGPHLPEQSLFDLRLLPGDDPKKKFIVFISANDDGVKVPEAKPLSGRKWYIPYSKEVADEIRVALTPDQWGEEKSGLKMGLRLRKQSIAVGQPVIAEVIIHNNAKKDWELSQHRYNIYDYWPETWFEVTAPDGKKWQLRKQVGKISEADSPYTLTLKPGDSYIHAIRLDNWPAHVNWAESSEPIRDLFAKAGEYSITAHYRYSPPLQIGTWTADFASKPEKLLISDPDQWGNATDGLKSRVRLTKPAFKSGEALSFALDLKNVGDKTVEDYPVGQQCKIELDGTSYSYTAPLSVPTSLVKLEPDKEYSAHVQVTTDQWWQDAKGNALMLVAGKHKLSVSYPLPGGGAERIVSKFVEFDVEAEKN